MTYFVRSPCSCIRDVVVFIFGVPRPHFPSSNKSSNSSTTSFIHFITDFPILAFHWIHSICAFSIFINCLYFFHFHLFIRSIYSTIISSSKSNLRVVNSQRLFFPFLHQNLHSLASPFLIYYLVFLFSNSIIILCKLFGTLLLLNSKYFRFIYSIEALFDFLNGISFYLIHRYRVSVSSVVLHFNFLLLNNWRIYIV